MVRSLLEATGDFPPRWTGPKTVILVTDGVETCTGSIKAVAEAYRDPEKAHQLTKGGGTVVHVVGFDIADRKADEQLRALAEAGRGNYYKAADAKRLAEALRNAVGSTAYLVYDAANDTVAARGLINGGAVALPAGRYRLDLPGAHPRSLAFRIDEGQSLEFQLTNDGELRSSINAEH